MRSSTPSTNTNLDYTAMYGHTFITDGHDGVICAYNVHSVWQCLGVNIIDHTGQKKPKIAQLTSISSQDVKIVP